MSEGGTVGRQGHIGGEDSRRIGTCQRTVYLDQPDAVFGVLHQLVEVSLPAEEGVADVSRLLLLLLLPDGRGKLPLGQLS